MSEVLGSGDYRYRVIEGWGELPEGWRYGEVAGIAIDRKDRVYIFNRGAHPMIVFDRDGNFLRSWGEGLFVRAHGVHIGPDDTIYCTDDGDHTMRKLTLEGTLLMELGVPGKPAPYVSGDPFNRCTHTALSPEQEIYVADGYGNARVHKYAPNGKLLFSWGEPGTGHGQFNIVHNIVTDADGWVYVADRENHRVQVFDGKGRYEAQWNNIHRPCGLSMPYASQPVCYIGELGPGGKVNEQMPGIGPRVSVVTHKGELLARIGDFEGAGRPSKFIAPHGVAVDSTGALYVGEVSRTQLRNSGHAVPEDRDPHCLTKFAKVA